MNSFADKSITRLPVRTRQQYGKSRAGCQQCKRSRRKCDLRQSGCRNCERRNVQCGGYEVPLRWFSKHQHSHTRARRSISTSIDAGSMLSCDERSQIGVARSGNTPKHQKAQRQLSFVASADCHNRLRNYDGSLRAGHQNKPPRSERCAYDGHTVRAFHLCRDKHLQSDSAMVKDDISLTIQSWEDHVASSSLPRDLVDVGTTLIAYWFHSVCPMWSIFDSEVNFNRRIALDKWAYSEPVFCSLQAMSAAYLVSRTPRLKISFRSLIDQAASVTERVMQVGYPRTGVAVDVVFAVFALGTTSHWSGSSTVGLRWLEAARYLLQAWKSNEDVTDMPTFLYGYFRQALSYWEMLACLTREVPSLEQLNSAATSYEWQLAGSKKDTVPCARPESHALELYPSLAGTRPNSWCGVSSEVIEIFGKVIALCYGARCRCSTTGGHSLDAPCSGRVRSGLDLARQLRTDLLKLDFSAAVDTDTALGFCLQTLDDRTPTSHLLQIAEAYRTASLLQLYLTFGGLIHGDPTQLPIAATNNQYLQSPTCFMAGTVAEVAVQLVEDLERIPRDSGSKRAQLMLYVAAATGLKLNCHSLEALSNRSLVDGPPELKIWQARKVVLDRLTMLEQALPPKPIKIAKDLVESVWTAYDGRRHQQERIHWLDVMMDTGLRTMFG